ncbi:MAG: RNA-binding protein [Crocinitomicaceae bacterium]|nr:RNA-binding protein [Crocinitomicaceae bacterium]
MTSIFVAKLDFGVSKEQLTQLFEEYGRVTKVNIPTDKETGKPRGFAFVEMPDADEANNAISALDGFEINRRRLAVKIAENRNDNNKPQTRSSFNSNQRRESNYSATTNNENEEKAGQLTPSDFDKPENRKKSSKSKKRGFDTDSDRAKKTKMPAYKKSGKNFRYFEEDEPLENDLFSFDEDEDDLLD